jgi:hypothetical protein
MTMQMQNFFGNGGVYNGSYGYPAGSYRPIQNFTGGRQTYSADIQKQLDALSEQYRKRQISAADFYARTSALRAEGKRQAAMTPLEKLQSEYQKAQDEAKAANESRYQGLLTEQKGMGEQEAKDIRSTYSGLATQGQQDLVSRGLAASTIAPTMQAGYARRETAELGRLGDRLREQRLGIMERRSDTYPDLGQLQSLAGMVGSYGGAGGGGGSSSYPNYVGPPTGVSPPAQTPTTANAGGRLSLAGLGSYARRGTSLFDWEG